MKKYTLNAIVLVAIVYVFALLALVLPKQDISESERRKLAEFPKFTVESFLSGKFASDFEEYSTDNFPFRDTFRSIKSVVNYKLFGKSDNNDIYIHNGSMMKLEKKLDEGSVENALLKFEKLYKNYFEGTGVNLYTSVIPDKAYFAKKEGAKIPTYDYEKLFSLVREGMPYAEYIEIAPLLTLSDYYLTDSHWRQEKIENVAEKLFEVMVKENFGAPTYELCDSGIDFRGVYSGQAALPGGSESLYYMDHEIFKDCIVTNYETGKAGHIYDFGKLTSRDPYELFLEGSCAAMKIENLANTRGKKLIIFRDSYGSSITPLLLFEYSEVLLFDIRYMSSDMVGDYIDFNNPDFPETDVLFLYSSTLLNSSGVLR